MAIKKIANCFEHVVDARQDFLHLLSSPPQILNQLSWLVLITNIRLSIEGGRLYP